MLGSCAIRRKNVRPPVVAARAPRAMNSSGRFDRFSMALQHERIVHSKQRTSKHHKRDVRVFGEKFPNLNLDSVFHRCHLLSSLMKAIGVCTDESAKRSWPRQTESCLCDAKAFDTLIGMRKNCEKVSILRNKYWYHDLDSIYEITIKIQDHLPASSHSPTVPRA